MRGHIRKRGKVWAVVVDIGRDETGRRRQRWNSGYGTRREAQEALTELLGRVQRGTYVEPTKQTLGGFLGDRLDARRSQLRPSTWHGYDKNVKAYILPHLGSVPLQALRPQHLNRFYSQLLEDGRRDGKGGLSARTVVHIHRMLHRAFRDATRWQLLPNNPADCADPPRAASPEMKVWTPSQLKTFLLSVEGDRLYALWLLMASTGLRRGEALGLRWQDADLDAGRLAITQTLLDINNELSFGEPKTAKGRRSVALDQATVMGLRAHRVRQAEEKLAFGPGYNEAGLAFCQEDGAPIRPAWLTRAFCQRVAATGVPPPRSLPHSRNDRSGGWRSPESSLRTPRPQHGEYHSRHLFPQHPGAPRAGRRDGFQARVRELTFAECLQMLGMVNRNRPVEGRFRI